ncbi:chromosome segregation ATPase [Rhizobium sp. SG_E_25_P2]|uniref:hypothetical protein n=1 Tax=Rhizobium sp. SG_E_25_P2 TaxID=2879942 RepID=UPI00247610C0|nr:hypothetical protein [Rhizobium sp. SG_E_25_P2]MDH6268348.1 chromosome segregation ATPase [Rhizobium sp. SG_E_25_P2]
MSKQTNTDKAAKLGAADAHTGGDVKFHKNYLAALDMKMDTLELKLDRVEELSDRATYLENTILDIKLDVEDDGMTALDKIELKDLRTELRHVENRLDHLPSQEQLLNRLDRLAEDYAEKAEDWGL